MSETLPLTSRDATRSRLVEVAAHLLATEGAGAVTTRSVALAAGVQAPTIYRIFGDKTGLFDAVAEYGFASYMAQKAPVDEAGDPVDGLRIGWELHVGFGLANPALFRIMQLAQNSTDTQAIADAGGEVLRQRVLRVAQAGRLRVPEQRAVDLIRAAGTGVVITLIDQPEDTRDGALADLAWEAICAAILVDARPAEASAPAAAAVTLRAALPELDALSTAERALFAEWLDRVAAN